MAELIITTCDYCNTNQEITKRNGRGYVMVCESDAVALFDWMIDEKTGKIKCLDCQEEGEK